MERKKWKKRIKTACEDVGAYKPSFDSAIDTLAALLEARDTAQEQYDAGGAKAMIEYKGSTGKTAYKKNPALVAILECNAQALQYMNALGLTPAGIKKLNTDALEGGGGAFADLLARINE